MLTKENSGYKIKASKHLQKKVSLIADLRTSDSILAAAMELFSEKGYTAVTTKEIAAQAKVNEVTLFRYFKTKLLLYQKVFSKFIFEPSFEEDFHKQISGELFKDLLNFVEFFQDIVLKNVKLLQMNLKDSSELLAQEDENNLLRRFPRLARQELASYFTIMKEKGLVTKEPEELAVSFLMLTVGLNVSLVLAGIEMEQSLTKYREMLVEIFVKGIRS